MVACAERPRYAGAVMTAVAAKYAKRYWKKYEAISAWTAMAAYMSTFVLWGIAFLPDSGERALIALSVIPLGVLLDYVLHRWQTGRPNWESELITSCIVTVLMPTGIEWYVPPLAVAVAIGSKHFLLLGNRGNKRHIFNPASTGVALTALLFGYSLGWWPDSFLWLTIAFGLLNAWRAKRVTASVTFLAVYAALLALTLGSLPLGGFQLGGPGVQSVPLILPYFFAFFMVVEPVTSLGPRRQQVEFGTLVALTTFALSYVPAVAPAAPLWGLLVANVYARLRTAGSGA